MTASASIAFLKLTVSDLTRAQHFYEAALGFERVNGFDTPDFEEVILAQPGVAFQLMLLRYKDGRAAQADHGPTGFSTVDIAASHAALVAAGATPRGEVVDVGGGILVAFLGDPDGHEIELVQFPA